MRIFAVFALVGGLSLANPAHSQSRLNSQPVAAPDAWSGFYLGVNAGGAWSGRNLSIDYTEGGWDPGPDMGTANASSAIGGFHGGYNFRMTPSWLLGIEADWDWANLRRSETGALTLGGTPFRGSSMLMDDKLDWLASVRGRVGYTFNNVLLFGSGGAAFTKTSYTGFLVPKGNPIPQSPYGFEKNNTGWVAGAGIEWLAAANWTVRAEYLHYDFGGETFTKFSNSSSQLYLQYGAQHIDSVRVAFSYRIN